jgi:hypothetical protein
MPLPKWLAGETPLARSASGAASHDEVGELLDLQQLSALQAAHTRGAADFTAIVHSSSVLHQWFARWR